VKLQIFLGIGAVVAVILIVLKGTRKIWVCGWLSVLWRVLLLGRH
jgi:hypothetical protein